MSFNSDPSKQTQEVIFSRKRQNLTDNSVYFNCNLVQQVPPKKHLRMDLDTKLNFQEHLNNIQSKADKTIGLLRQLQAVLLRLPLVTIYKAFIRHHPDYGDIIYDQAYKESFYQKLKSIQYNPTLAITGAIRGNSRERLYQELGLESIQKRRWCRKLCYLLKIIKGQSPDYLSKIIPSIRRACNTRNVDYIPYFNTKQFFRNSFFPSTLIDGLIQTLI